MLYLGVVTIIVAAITAYQNYGNRRAAEQNASINAAANRANVRMVSAFIVKEKTSPFLWTNIQIRVKNFGKATAFEVHALLSVGPVRKRREITVPIIGGVSGPIRRPALEPGQEMYIPELKVSVEPNSDDLPETQIYSEVRYIDSLDDSRVAVGSCFKAGAITLKALERAILQRPPESRPPDAKAEAIAVFERMPERLPLIDCGQPEPVVRTPSR